MKCPNCKVPLSTSPLHRIQNLEPVGAPMLGHIIADVLNITPVHIYKCSTCGKLCFELHPTECIRAVEDE